jgi:hypothetical protein
MLLPLNPSQIARLGVAPRSRVAPHEGPEMVVVGEWVASIDGNKDRNKKDIFGILLHQVLWASKAISHR